jgi:hypothetical protein
LSATLERAAVSVDVGDHLARRAFDGDGWAHHSGINRCCSTLERAAVSIDVGDLLALRALDSDGWAHHSGITRCCSTLVRAAVAVGVGVRSAPCEGHDERAQEAERCEHGAHSRIWMSSLHEGGAVGPGEPHPVVRTIRTRSIRMRIC